MKATLDTNCIYAITAHESAEASVRELVRLHDAGVIELALVYTGGAERPRKGEQPTTPDAFQRRLRDAKLDHLPILKGVCFLNMGFYLDDGLFFGSEGDFAQVERIHRILFGQIPYNSEAYIQQIGDENRADKKWNNAMLDVLTFWAHLYYNRDIFVSDDDIFHKSKKSSLLALGAKHIMRPTEAVAFIKQGSNPTNKQ